MTPDEVAERTRRATGAAVDAARALGLEVEHPVVLHDVFSVVVHLAPHPVVARIPVVLTAAADPAGQTARRQRELDVAAWLDAQGVPVVPPSALVPRSPIHRDGFVMTPPLSTFATTRLTLSRVMPEVHVPDSRWRTRAAVEMKDRPQPFIGHGKLGGWWIAERRCCRRLFSFWNIRLHGEHQRST